MLTEHPTIAPTLIAAHHEPIYRRRSTDAVEGFQAVVDQRGVVLAVPTKRHTLVQPAAIVSALDLALDEHGMGSQVEVGHAYYRRGRWGLRLDLPGDKFQPYGDPSDTVPNIWIENDHGTRGSLNFFGGSIRWRCKNGLVLGTLVAEARRRHVGTIDLFATVSKVVAGIEAWVSTERVISAALVATHYPLMMLPSRERSVELEPKDRKLLHRILASMPPRYEGRFAQAVQENRREIGDNLWALQQAVSETATHTMRGRAARDWAAAQAQDIRSMDAVLASI